MPSPARSDLLPSPQTFPSGPARDLTLVAVLHPARFAAEIGVTVPRNIPLSLGAVEYVEVDVTESTGTDLTNVEVQISLGTWTTPGQWYDADRLIRPTVASMQVSLLIGDSLILPAGRYWPWVKIADSSETVVVQCLSTLTIS